MKKALNLGVIGIDHGHIFDMLDEMIKEGCSCNYFWTDGDPLTLQEFNKKYPNIKRTNVLMSEESILLKKKENDYLQEIFYKGAKQKSFF